MRLFSFVKLAALVFVLSATVAVAGVSIYFRIEQYKFRRQAEQLLTDVREVELNKANATRVRLVVRKWGFKEWGRAPGQPCTEDDCVYRLELMPELARTHGLGDPFAPLQPMDWLGLRPTVVNAWLNIRGQTLRSVSVSVWTLGRGCDRINCTIVGDATTRQVGHSWSEYEPPDVRLKHSLLHPSYLVGSFRAVLNADTGGSPSMIIWTELSPGAKTADVLRLMQFDFVA